MDFQQFVQEIGSMIAPQPIMDVPALQAQADAASTTTTPRPPVTTSTPRGREHVLEDGICWIKEEFARQQQEALSTLKQEAYQVKVLEEEITHLDAQLAQLTEQRQRKLSALHSSKTNLEQAKAHIDTASQEVELRIQRLKEALQA